MATKKTARRRPTARVVQGRHLLALGDSVMWGQGLADKDKFVNQVARGLEKASRNKVKYTVSMLAHSGAVIGTGASLSNNKACEQFVHGEVPTSYPNVRTQVEIAAGNGHDYLEARPWDTPPQKKTKKALARRLGSGYRPDLILVDGGANDIGIFDIMSPIEFAKLKKINSVKALLKLFDLPYTRAELQKDVQKKCGKRMQALLEQIHRRFPDADIVVTGYYPVFTRGSLDTEAETIAGMMLAKAPALLNSTAFGRALVLLSKLVKKFLVKRSAAFQSESSKAFRAAIKAVKTKTGFKRIYFAAPKFNANNGAFASKSFIWEFDLIEVKNRKKKKTKRKKGWFKKLASAAIDLAIPGNTVKDVGKTLQALKGAKRTKSHGAFLEVLAVDDPAEKARVQAFDKFAKKCTKVRGEKFFSHRGSIAHPNAKGADAYTKAIMASLKKARRIQALTK